MTYRKLVAVNGVLALALMVPAVSLRADESRKSRVGEPCPAFSLQDVQGKTYDIEAFRGKSAVVIAFLGNGCPLVPLYVPRLHELADAYAGRGVQFLAINSNRQDTADELRQFAKETALRLPLLKDERNAVADQFAAQRTPEVFVVDQQGVVRYQGRIDDQYGVGYQRPKVTQRYLADALEAVLAGKPVATSQTEPEGCLIGRVVEAKDKTITYTQHVSRILQNRCQVCHRPGQVAPFPLLSYDDAAGWGPMIKEVVRKRQMPPWHADPHIGKFSNSRRLTDEEVATLSAWVDAGTPEGEPGHLPPPREFPSEWALGTPDLVLHMGEEFTIPASGGDLYRYFALPTGLKENRWVRAVEIRPGNRRVVHHVIAMVRGKEVDGRRRGGLGGLLAPAMNTSDSPSGMGWLAAMAPGNEVMVYPPGTAKLVAAESNIVFQMHYHPSTVEEKDRTSIALYFSDEPSPQMMRTHGIAQPRFVIPPGGKGVEVKATIVLPFDIRLWSLMPHMHLRGSDVKFVAMLPDGGTETLLHVPRWDFNWQTTYRLVEPKSLPKGTRIDVIAHYDNSADNPNNPNPNATVLWGEPTYAEMLIGFVDFTVERRAESAKTSGTGADE